ncbi:hypothetical protein AX16_003006 [Volvariella volvacea WC 439]|nr:hypothetical protein AX16_003006 [Volvariella volvacea WC 439]
MTCHDTSIHFDPFLKKRLVGRIKRRVFLGVDNYTAPLKDGNDRSEMHAVQYYICRGFFEEISCNVHGVVDYGLVVGEDPSFPSEWSTNPSLPVWETEPWHPPGAADITWIHGTEYTIGLSRDDVTALADAYLHSSPRRLYKNIKDHCKPQRYIRNHPELITYSTERVFAVLRRRKSGDKELEQDPNADLRPCCDGLVPAPGWTREDIMAIFEGLSPEALGLPESALEQEDYTHWHCTTPSSVFRARKEIQARKKRSRKASKGGKNVKSG